MQSFPFLWPYLCPCIAPPPEDIRTGCTDTWAGISAAAASDEGSEFAASVIWIGHPAIHNRSAAMVHLPNHPRSLTAGHVDVADGCRKYLDIVRNDDDSRRTDWPLP